MPEHGTVNRYKNVGCRCAACTRANTESGRQQRAAYLRAPSRKRPKGKSKGRSIPLSGHACERVGCSNDAVGDAFCSATCARQFYGVEAPSKL